MGLVLLDYLGDEGGNIIADADADFIRAVVGGEGLAKGCEAKHTKLAKFVAHYSSVNVLFSRRSSRRVGK